MNDVGSPSHVLSFSPGFTEHDHPDVRSMFVEMFASLIALQTTLEETMRKENEPVLDVLFHLYHLLLQAQPSHGKATSSLSLYLSDLPHSTR